MPYGLIVFYLCGAGAISGIPTSVICGGGERLIQIKQQDLIWELAPVRVGRDAARFCVDPDQLCRRFHHYAETQAAKDVPRSKP